MIQPVRQVQDVHGKVLTPGARVRKVDMVVAYGDRAVVRIVEAVGRDGHLRGYAMVTGLLGWQSATQFEKVA